MRNRHAAQGALIFIFSLLVGLYILSSFPGKSPEAEDTIEQNDYLSVFCPAAFEQGEGGRLTATLENRSGAAQTYIVTTEVVNYLASYSARKPVICQEELPLEAGESAEVFCDVEAANVGGSTYIRVRVNSQPGDSEVVALCNNPSRAVGTAARTPVGIAGLLLSIGGMASGLAMMAKKQ